MYSYFYFSYMNAIILLSITSIVLVPGLLAQEAPAADDAPNFSVAPVKVMTCGYARKPDRKPFKSFSANFLRLQGDTEPNDSLESARLIPLGFKDGFQSDLDIQAKIDEPFDTDWMKFEAEGGDTLGVAVTAVDGNRVDSMLSLVNATGEILLRNESHGGIASNFPPESPLPAATFSTDPALSYSFSSTGTYYLKINGEGASSGAYLAQIRLRHPPLQDRSAGTCQRLFLDFDGVKNFDASTYFGNQALPMTNMSRFGAFLGRWGIASTKENELIRRITEEVRRSFDHLIAGTDCKIEISNSLDEADIFSEKNPEVSRVIVGGTIAEFGIATIGLSECVDPGNFSANDTAVVLLDALSRSADDQNSILSLRRASSLSTEDAVVRVLGRVIVHEACHFLGCWHTDYGSKQPSLADDGPNLANLAGVGPDRVLGTGDDLEVVICDDCFSERESISASPREDIEAVTAKVKAALAVGTKTLEAEEIAVKRVITQLSMAQELQERVAFKAEPTIEETRQILQLPPAAPGETVSAEPAVQPRFEQAIEQFRQRLDSIESQK